ncbi:sigma-70 family RNA polymerase sigma factor [Gemmata sp. JC717]|uniref:RNA polymerase sigma factor n=1 Tax=Gemmata algarum TaxID=2975278 RepID=UPI0021BB3687|nr:sigma-70 family RNA polymerase sigma factor [Gemmata algarum]MDY3555760.1 sigma-70 family RNA polymerase sigma factor [Gemmata algarum]
MAEPTPPPPPDPPAASDRSLLARVRDGSQDAATTLYERYSQRLFSLAKARCAEDLAARVDAEDIVQSVFGSFFRGASQGFYDAPSGEEIWGLLLVIALNKIRAKGAHHRAAKRDVRKTVSGDALGDSGLEPPASDGAALALLRMVVDEVVETLPEGHREVVRLRIDGFEIAEIATRTGKSMRTTERVLQEFRSRMAAEFGEGHSNG